MKLAVLVNRAEELVPTMTTAMLIAAAAARGHKLWTIDVTQLGLGADGALCAAARPVAQSSGSQSSGSQSCGELLAALASTRTETLALEGLDALLVRTNPARDVARTWAHQSALELLELLRDRGVAVLNDPAGLARASSKLFLARLPEGLAPPGMVTRDVAQVESYIAAHGRCVIKPLRGTRGSGVFILEPGERNLAAIVEAASRDSLALVQPYLPAAEDGDLRLVLLDGQPLVVDGQLGAIRRQPAAGDFRSNLHAGGKPAPAVLTPALQRIASELAPLLNREGLWLVGADLVGETVLELNVFSTGGLYHANRFGEVDFAAAVIEQLELKLG